jgi:hypothetical protein
MQMEQAQTAATVAAAARDAALEHLSAADTALIVERDTHAKTLAGLVAANRAVLAHAVGRLARRETDAARRKQATPEKLRAWASTFYEEHEIDLWATELAPSLGVHLALCGRTDDADTAARDFAMAHMAVSRQQIEAVAASDPEDYQRALAATMARWEGPRVAATVDAWIGHEIEHVRTI